VLKVYIAGPLSTGVYSDITRNVRNAIDHADSIMMLGGAPYLPHLSHFWNLFHVHSWEEWMTLDHEYIQLCGAVYRLPGESKGADQEVQWAMSLGIPIYHRMEEIAEAIKRYNFQLSQLRA